MNVGKKEIMRSTYRDETPPKMARELVVVLASARARERERWR